MSAPKIVFENGIKTPESKAAPKIVFENGIQTPESKTASKNSKTTTPVMLPTLEALPSLSRSILEGKADPGLVLQVNQAKNSAAQNSIAAQPTSAQKLQSAARFFSGTLPAVAENERKLGQYALSAQSTATTNQRDLPQIKSELEAARSAEKNAMNRLNDYMLTYSGALDLRDPAELQALKDTATAATEARKRLEQEYNAHEGSFNDQYGEFSGAEKALIGIIGSPIAAVDVIAQTAKSAIGGDNTMEMDTLAMQNYKKAQQLKASATENLSGAGKFLADTGISVAQNLYALPMNVVMPGGSLAVMGATAAADKMAELGDRGESATRSLVRGAISGGIEAATEKIPLDSLADLVKTGGKGVIKNLLKQGGVEATEEGIAYAANYIADKMAKDPEATWDWADFANNVASGGMSGLFFGLGGTAVNRVSNSSINSNGVFLPGSGLDTPVQTKQTTQSDTTLPTQPATVPNSVNQTQDTTAQNAALEAVQAQKNTASTGETEVSLVQRIQKAIPQMQGAAPVATVTGNELPQGSRIVDRLTQFVNAIGNKVSRPGFGDVLFSRGKIKSSMIGHGIGDAKIETFAAVPAVIQNGQQIDYQKNWKGRSYDTYTFMAPVTYRGARTYLGVIVQKDSTSNRYYLHEVVDENGAVIYKNNEAPAAASDGTSALAGDLDTVADTGTNRIMPQVEKKVNGQAVRTEDQSDTVIGQELPVFEQQTVETLPVIERRAAEEPPVMTGGMNNGEQLQATGNRAADGGTAGIRKNLSDRGRGRISDEGTGGEAGVLADSPEGARRRAADQGRAAIERQNLAKTLRGEKVSSQSLGVKQGTDAQTLTVVQKDAWDDGMQDTAERVRQETGKEVTYVLGRIQLEDSSGELHHVRGVYSRDGIILQADNMRLSIDQIADHEIFHSKSAQSPGLISQIEERITERYGREELDKAIDTYIRKLRGVIDVPENATQFEMDDAMQAVMEELFADAYAGINAFSAHAEQFNETVEQTMDQRGVGRGQTTAATERTTGPPDTRYSADDEAEDSQGRHLSLEQSEYFKNSQARDSRGRLLTLYHQTENEFTVFEPRHQGAGTRDDGTPFGIFMKTSPEDIGLRGQRQMELYANITNPLYAYNREALKRRLEELSPEYAGLMEEHRKLDDTYHEKFESAKKALQDFMIEWRKENQDAGRSALYDVPEFNTLYEAEDAAVEEWTAKADELSTRAKEVLTQALRKAGYDGVILSTDAGSFGRSTNAYIALDPQQVKNVTNKTPTNDPDIRFSVDDETDNDTQEQKRKTKKPVAESKPVIAKNDLRKNMLSLFSIPEGQRAELGTVIDQYADRLLKNGVLTEDDRAAFFDRMYSSGVMSVPADEYYQAGREIVKGGKVYVNEQVRAEFGDDWGEFRKRAFGAGVYLTGNQADSGVDVWNTELSEMLPGLFNASDTDSRDVLERIVQIAEEGKDEKVGLAEYTAMLAEQEYISEDELLDNMERQMDWALRTFAEKANLEIKLRDRTGIKLAQEREQRREAMHRQRENRELRELQQRTLKQLQWLSKNRYKAPQELKAAWDEVLGDIDIYAVNAANEMNWSKKYQATWRDLAEMYKDAEKNDPNFLRSAELERIVARLDYKKIGDMDIGALQDLYKAAVGIRTEFYNRNNVINDEMNRMFSEVYTDAKQEIETAAGKYKGGIADRFMNREQLTPMNMLERMGGWNPDGAFYSMARQLEKGERDSRDYTVRAKRQLQGFLEEHEDWAKRADGQGKDAVWYELEVPELLELRMGDKPIFGKTVKVYMTPAQKVHLYLESKSEDNLRHMMGGRTFVNKELYSNGKRSEALAQGTTVKLAPETVKKIVSDLTEEEMALAQALSSYYNGFASERINKVSNALYGFDKAVSQAYTPIYTNQNYTKSELGVFDVTAEGVGNLKGRVQGARNPSYNISAFDAFERHVDQTARFVGMAIPARNWNTLLNWRESNNSMGDVITHKWGQEGKTYIEDLLVELQGGKTTEERSTAEKIMDTALSNYISSVFGFNPSIVFKQAMSFPLAGTYLGWENMPNIQKALATDEGLINTYTSELAYRLMGYSTPETAQLKDNPSKLDQNKALKFVFRGGAITAMDGWTVKTIWRWAENTVKRTNPDLEVGTQEQIDAGQSPFYRAVAKEFEEAVSRSQPMYDVMHRSQIMRTSNKAVRALTLFKTVPQQQYNMLRQVEGEAKHYKREYQNGNVTKEEYTQAKKKVGRAALGVIAAGLGIEAINFLNALLKNRAKRYRDDEGELTWASGWRQFLEGFTSDNLGMIIGGDLTVEILGSVILGDNWYGIETPGITQIEDVLEKFISGCQTIQGLVQDGYKVLSNGGDLGEYFRRHGADYLGALDEALSTVLTYFGGVAANNIKSYALGALSWMSPQLATAYEDLLATADKSGLAGLTGEALETRVGDVLKNRLGSADDETAAALAGLYEAGYKTAIPTDTPNKVTVNSEEKKLNAYQQQFYDTVWRESVGDSLDELVSSKEFLNADAETQAKMAAKLYSYAAEKAKAALFEDYETDSWVEDADAAVQDGDTLAEWIAWRALSTGVTTNFEKIADAGLSKEDALDIAQKISELEPLEGKTTVSSLQKYRAVIDTGLTEKEQMAALSSLMGESEYLKLQTGYSFGVTPETYVSCKESLPQYDADGNGSYKQEEVRAAIDALNSLSTDQKAALWQIQSKSWKPANNPYSKSVGQKVYDALSEEAEESTPQELPSRDWSAVIGLPSLVDE